MEGLKVFTDGVSRGNPGDAGFGVVIQDDEGQVLEELSGYLGTTTNNVAEYTALIEALKAVAGYGDVKVEIFADSELMVRQINGLYQVKSPSLYPLFQEAKKRMSQMRQVTITHIPRELNKEADAAANRAVDRKQERLKRYASEQGG